MRIIPLTHGKVAFVDDEDFERVYQFSWHAYLGNSGIWYAKRASSHIDGKQHTIRLHHFVLRLSKPFPLVDHKNRDGLDCQKRNLRPATRSQNRANSIRHRPGFKGVYLVSPQYARPWQATIKVDGHNKSLGYYTTAEEAARAYDIAALVQFGEFARTNFTYEDDKLIRARI